jgi:hypothetical protein
LRGAGGDSIRGRVDAREFAALGIKAMLSSLWLNIINN